MPASHNIPRGRASLEVLRAEAHQERDTVVHERLLAGEDPWDFMDELPTVFCTGGHIPWRANRD